MLIGGYVTILDGYFKILKINIFKECRMKNKIGLIALVLSMVFLSGCGSSGSSDTASEGSETVQTVFSHELIVGKTYEIMGNDRDTTLTWSQAEVSFVDNGHSGTLSYSIDANGIISIETPDGLATYTLISVEANGDLKVTEKQPEGEKELLWVLL